MLLVEPDPQPTKTPNTQVYETSQEMDGCDSFGWPTILWGVILGTLAPFPLFANFCMMKSCIA